MANAMLNFPPASAASAGPATPPHWDTILSAAQKNNAEEVLRLINDEGVPPSHGNFVGQTALHIAALWGNVETMEVLIEAGASVNAQNQIAKMTPLHCAIRGTFQSFRESHARRLECVKLLLRAGADGKICDLRGKDAFDSIDDAVKESNERNMGNIEEEMAEMRIAFEEARLEMSPLVEFIDKLDVRGVEERLRGGNDGEGDVRQIKLSKALLSAVEKFQSYIDGGGDDGGACESLRDIIRCLLEAGADPNCADPLEGAPLHTISSCASLATSVVGMVVAADIGRDLISRGATICPATKALLPNAAHRGKLHAVEYLIKDVGSDPNVVWRQGMTPLILAARAGRADIVHLLLTCDTLDLDIVDNAGKTAVDYAIANGRNEIVTLLLERKLHLCTTTTEVLAQAENNI